MRTSNPTLKGDRFDSRAYLTGEPTAETMTVKGAVNKALLLILMAMCSATITWTSVAHGGPDTAIPWMIGGALLGFGMALVISRNPRLAPSLAPVYALIEGCFLGAASCVFNTAYHGIVLQAVLITFGVSITMLLAYQSGAIRATPMFARVVIAATGGVALVYLMSIGMYMFGMRMPLINDATPVGILINVAILGLAAMNLVLDFDLIEKGAERGAPKFMEWYGGFALVVTLFWIYIESLRLLSKLRR